MGRNRAGRAMPVVYQFSFLAGASEDFAGEGQSKFCQELRGLETSPPNEGGRGEARTVDGGVMLTYVPMHSSLLGDEAVNPDVAGKALLLSFKMPELDGNIFAVVRNGEGRAEYASSEQVGRAGEVPHIYQELWNGASALDPSVGYAAGAGWNPPWRASGRNTLDGNEDTPYG